MYKGIIALNNKKCLFVKKEKITLMNKNIIVLKVQKNISEKKIERLRKKYDLEYIYITSDIDKNKQKSKRVINYFIENIIRIKNKNNVTLNIVSDDYKTTVDFINNNYKKYKSINLISEKNFTEYINKMYGECGIIITQNAPVKWFDSNTRVINFTDKFYDGNSFDVYKNEYRFAVDERLSFIEKYEKNISDSTVDFLNILVNNTYSQSFYDEFSVKLLTFT